MAGWSMHAADYQDLPQSSLKEMLKQQLRGKLKIADDLQVEAAVSVGWREYEDIIALRGSWEALRDQALKSGYEQVDSDGSLCPPILEPIAKWIDRTGFHPEITLWKQDPGVVYTIKIDRRKNLLLIIVQDY